MSERLRIAKDTAVFTLATLVSQGLAVVLAVFIRRELGPEAMGIWALLQVVLSYINYSSLGIVSAVCRQIPLLRAEGAGDAKIERMKDLGYTYLNAVSFATALGLIAAALLFRARLSDAVFFGCFAIAGVTLLERSVGYVIQVLYADKKFALVSRFRTYSAFVNAALTFVLVKNFHLYGFFAAVLLSFTFDYGYLRLRSKLRFKTLWSLGEFLELLKFGLPIAMLAASNTLFFSMDRLTIGKFLGLAPLGMYTIALMAGRYVFLLPNAFQIVLLPSTLEKFGARSGPEARKNVSVLPGRLMTVYFSISLAALWIFVPVLCRWLLPKFVEGVPATKALIFCYAFMALFTQINQVLLGLRRHTWTIPLVLALSAAVWGANAWIARQGGGLFDMALVMTAAMAMAYAAALYFALTTMMPFAEYLWNLLLNLVPLAYTASVLTAFDRAHPVDSLVSAAVKFAAYLACWLLLALAMERKTGILRTLKDLLAGWISKTKIVPLKEAV